MSTDTDTTPAPQDAPKDPAEILSEILAPEVIRDLVTKLARVPDLHERQVKAHEKMAEALTEFVKETVIFNEAFKRYVEMTTGNVVGR